MPAINGPADQYFLNYLKMVDRRLKALETQQNWGITDNNLKLRIRGGLQPDGTYGIWMLNPTTGAVVAKFTGTKVEFLSSAGSVLIDLTDTGLAVYSATGKLLIDLAATGLGVFDSTGYNRVQVGELANGDYGLQVVDHSTGVKTEFLPVYTAEATATVTTTTKTTWVDLGGPSITATVGASGKSLITFSAFSSISASTTAGIGAFVGIGVDGGPPPSGGGKPNAGFVTTNVKLGVTTANAFVMTTTPGSHTFKMWYFAQKVGALFSGRFMQVRPL